MTVAMQRGPSIPDADLAVAAATGDAGAFAELYARYVNRVFARVTHIIGPGPDREDVLQQVFLELHRALPRFRGESTVSTFLYRITINVTCDHLRHRTRRAAEHDPAALDELSDDDPNPEDRACRREELGQIFTLLDRIKPKKRIAFVLVAVEGLTIDEAAELVGAQPDAVKQRVLHARRELLALMQSAERPADPGVPWNGSTSWWQRRRARDSGSTASRVRASPPSFGQVLRPSADPPRAGRFARDSTTA